MVSEPGGEVVVIVGFDQVDGVFLVDLAEGEDLRGGSGSKVLIQSTKGCL